PSVNLTPAKRIPAACAVAQLMAFPPGCWNAATSTPCLAPLSRPAGTIPGAARPGLAAPAAPPGPASWLRSCGEWAAPTLNRLAERAAGWPPATPPAATLPAAAPPGAAPPARAAVRPDCVASATAGAALRPASVRLATAQQACVHQR